MGAHNTLLSDVQKKNGSESVLNSVFDNENEAVAKLEKEKEKKDKKK